MSEAIILPATPSDAVTAIHDTIRSAFTGTRLGEAPEPRDDFLPHVSLAYMSQDGPAEPLVSVLDRIASEPATATATHASLIILDRDQRMYQWRDFATATFAPPP